MIERDEFECVMGLFREAITLEGKARREFVEAIEDRGIREDVGRLLAQDEDSSALIPKDMNSQSVDDVLGKLVSDVALESTPDAIGDYDILETIGMGGMGVVYRARHRELGRVVALKVLRGSLLSPHMIRRFQEEIKALIRVQHPSIANIYEAGLHQHKGKTLPYFTMELIEGEHLIAHGSSLPLDAQCRLLAEIAQGIHHAHQKGVIHRDLKPSNIMVDVAGRAKILDFGVARTLNNRARVTKTAGERDSGTGTLAYMSPEQLELEVQDIDIRSDVYGLGVVGFELLTGALPYQREIRSMASAVRAICDEPRVHARSLMTSVPRDIDAILWQCLEKDPERRYQSASEVALEIERFLSRKPVKAREPSWFYVAGKWVQRHKRLASIATILFLAVLFGVWQWGRASRAEEELEWVNVSRIVLGLMEQADSLWPCELVEASALREWIQEAKRMQELGRIASKEAHSLAREKGTVNSRGEWTLGNSIDQDRYDQRVKFAQSCEVLGSDSGGPIGQAQERLRALESLESKMAETQSLWPEVFEDLLNQEGWEDVNLKPQYGFVPLRKNESGLWEFWHVLSGAKPEPSQDDDSLSHWHLAEETGMVFVLLPRQWVVIGAQRDSEEEPNYDSSAASFESLDEVEVEPILVAKYEMTQGQWVRAMFENPSHYVAGRRLLGVTIDLTYPVDTVSRYDCRTALSRYGLALPSRAQWEYAARGGVESPWWAGKSSEDFEVPPGNCRRRGPAPVGCFLRNPYGLHDTIGNVAEWTTDSLVIDESGGEASDPRYGVLRGGGATMGYEGARVSRRVSVQELSRNADMGCRAIVPWKSRALSSAND